MTNLTRNRPQSATMDTLWHMLLVNDKVSQQRNATSTRRCCKQ